MDGDLSQVTDPQITTVETIITNDELESDAVGEVVEAETYTDDFEVRLLVINWLLSHMVIVTMVTGWLLIMVIVTMVIGWLLTYAIVTTTIVTMVIGLVYSPWSCDYYSHSISSPLGWKCTIMSHFVLEYSNTEVHYKGDEIDYITMEEAVSQASSW